ncbi:protein FRIGIDA-like [Salvia splendens]|uniref:protein FRIGIDA-like n=1 Tax=Salvia splendens TaxID=180675 RepID=UPI001C25EFDD|nr:protein FRIGIDA-like [Salvia splendens]
MIATVTPPPAMAEATTYAVPALENLSPQANMLSDAPPHSPNLKNLLPPFLNSITQLKDFSDAMSGFLQCYDDLHSHLQSIKAATLALLPPEYPPISHSPPQRPEALANTTVEKQQDDKIPSKSELEGFCKAMCSRGVRKYLVSHLSNLPMLQEQVPKALRLAPNPWKLVLECLGKFFLQGSKAFARDSPMIPAREASILVLECFLLMRGLDVSSETDCGILDIDKAVEEEANVAALAWRKRLVIEGGLAKANQIDARGLLLFVACFGVPAMFQVEDMRDLVIAGNAKEIVSVLQKSHMLMSKISEMVEEMMKKKMEVDAVDIVYTFGLEERFNPHTILISFLREAKKTWKMSKKGSQGSPATLNEANKKQLDILKSIRRCLERHNIDAAKLLPGWQINEKIVILQKNITDFDRKLVVDKASQKRKSSETETSTRPKFQDAKRVRHVNHGAQQQKATVHVDSRRSLSGNGQYRVNSYAAPAVIYGGPGAGLVPEGMISSGVGATSHGGMLPTYALQEPVLVDAAGQLINRVTHPYSWQRESSINERYASQPPPIGLTSLYRASSSVEGLPGNTLSSVSHGIQGSTSDLYQYRAPSSVEGLPGNTTSSVGYGIRGSTSDLYHFADSIAEGELYPSNDPRSGTAGSSVVPPHLSSYLYQA